MRSIRERGGRKKVGSGPEFLARGGVGPYGRGMRKLLSVLVVLAALALGTTMAVATDSGGSYNANGAADAQYKVKPGCGPDKTDGVAGESGRHEGQPPMADDRQDCPNPPGQQP
jgi:hypothetical protein